MPKNWQNLKNITHSPTDSPTWIQEMLAHLKMCMITGELSHPGTESSGARARNRGDGRRFNEENLVPGSDRRYGDVVIEAVKLWLEENQVYYLLTILMPFRLLAHYQNVIQRTPLDRVEWRTVVRRIKMVRNNCTTRNERLISSCKDFNSAFPRSTDRGSGEVIMRFVQR